MLIVNSKPFTQNHAEFGEQSPLQLVLSYAQRCRTRFRAITTDGQPVGLQLPRGTEPLRSGEILISTDGTHISVQAACEPLYAVTACSDAVDPSFDLLRGAYHLGNRHIPLELSPEMLKLERDPVLKEMLERLGLCVKEIEAAFQPESGAYGGGHRHDHDHDGGSLGEQLSRQAHSH